MLKNKDLECIKEFFSKWDFQIYSDNVKKLKEKINADILKKAKENKAFFSFQNRNSKKFLFWNEFNIDMLYNSLFESKEDNLFKIVILFFISNKLNNLKVESYAFYSKLAEQMIKEFNALLQTVVEYIQVRGDLKKYFDSVLSSIAVRNLEEIINENETFLLVGRNGVGKTRWMQNLNFNSKVFKVNTFRNVNLFIENIGKELEKLMIIKEQKKEINSKIAKERENDFALEDNFIIDFFDNYKNSIKEKERKQFANKLSLNFNKISADYKMIGLDILNGFKYMVKNSLHALNSRYLSINSLSFGEKHLLYFLFVFISLKEEEKIIIIDEPEIGLNEEYLINFLEECQQDLLKNKKLILISHSEKLANWIKRKENSSILFFNEIESETLSLSNNIYKLNPEINLNIVFKVLLNTKNYQKCILIEGERDSIDINLYPLIYKSEYSFIPFGGTKEICHAVKKINKNKILEDKSVFKDKKIFAILDGEPISQNSKDKPNEYIQKTKLNAGIEYLFLEKDILNDILKILQKQKLLNKFDIEEIHNNQKEIINGHKKLKDEIKGKKTHHEFFLSNKITNKQVIEAIAKDDNLKEKIRKKIGIDLTKFDKLCKDIED